jgi:hypothetical protein
MRPTKTAANQDKVKAGLLENSGGSSWMSEVASTGTLKLGIRVLGSGGMQVFF